MEQRTIFDEIYQPRFQAYLDYTGKTHVSEVTNIEYTSWIDKHLRNYKQKKGIRKHQPLTEKQNEEFNQILFDLRGKP